MTRPANFSTARQKAWRKWLVGGALTALCAGAAFAQTQGPGQLPLLVGTGGSGMSFSVPIQTLLFFI